MSWFLIFFCNDDSHRHDARPPHARYGDRRERKNCVLLCTLCLVEKSSAYSGNNIVKMLRTHTQSSRFAAISVMFINTSPPLSIVCRRQCLPFSKKAQEGGTEQVPFHKYFSITAGTSAHFPGRHCCIPKRPFITSAGFHQSRSPNRPESLPSRCTPSLLDQRCCDSVVVERPQSTGNTGGTEVNTPVSWHFNAKLLFL